MAYKSINEYIDSFPDEIRVKLLEMKDFLFSLVPDATEAMSYGIPTLKMNGNLVHFAAFKSHIGFYPGDSGVENFKERLKDYKTSTGTIQFPFGKDIPYDLIREITLFRLEENMNKKKK